MCGIFGIWHPDGTAVDLTTVQRATMLLRHRGPDDEGYLLFNSRTGRLLLCGGQDTTPSLNLPPLEAARGQVFDLALGFRRLAILDLSPAGHQPMSSEDGRYWIIFNGEIYNYLELREELRRAGYTFRSGSDSEVLLTAYWHWGQAVLNRLIGMFAFAVLDTKGRRLFLARDFFGIKPLYYSSSAECFAFASEIKALRCLPSVGRQVDPHTLYTYLRFGITDHSERTLSASIRQLPPARYAEVDLRHAWQVIPQQYWQLKLDQTLDISLEDAANQLRELFLQNVRLHLRSDVPVGAALSGGIDSASIVMAMRHVQGSRLDIHSFSYIADEPSVNEEKWVDLIGATARISIHKIQPSPEDLIQDLEQLITAQDEPVSSTSMYAQHRVFRLAHQAGIKVMEDGQGADEMLGGYKEYILSYLVSLIHQRQWGKALRLGRAPAWTPNLRLLLFGQNVKPFLPSPVWNFALRRVGRDTEWLNVRWFTERGVNPRSPRENSQREQLRADLYNAFTQTSLPMLLRYEDRNSMAFSIESRVPFLTPDLVQFVFSLPEEHIISADGTSKAVFRRAMRGIVPDAVLDRRDKIGFATPESKWLPMLGAWVENILGGESIRQIGALKADNVLSDWRAILVGRKPFDFRVWRWINLVRWAEIYNVSFE